jgi:hypothetical protein
MYEYTERYLFINLGDVVRQTPCLCTPKSEWLATPLPSYVSLKHSVKFECSILRPNVALRVSHLTTNSLSHQCPTHPAYADGRAKLRSD